MKKLLFLCNIIAIIALTMTGCDKDDTYTDDELLQQDLIGSWYGQDNGSIFYFDKNGTYYDSVFIDLPLNNLATVIKGKYKIENGQLIFGESLYTYTIDEADPGVEQSVFFLNPVREVDLTEDGVLCLNEIQVYEHVDSTDEIYGKWKEKQIIVVYDRDMDPYFFSGESDLVLEFSRDTNVYTYSQYYQIGSENIENHNSLYTFKYEPPLITNSSNSGNWARFENGKIIIEGEERSYKRTKLWK